jgi:hypothetical protein
VKRNYASGLKKFNAEAQRKKRLNAKVQRGKDRKEQRKELTQRRGDAEREEEKKMCQISSSALLRFCVKVFPLHLCVKFVLCVDEVREIGQ